MYEFSFDQIHVIGMALMFILAFAIAWDFRGEIKVGLISCLFIASIAAIAWEVVLSLLAFGTVTLLLTALCITIEDSTKMKEGD